MSSSMASANHQTPRVQGHGGADCETVAGSEVRRGGPPIWWKRTVSVGKGAAWWCSGDLLEVGEMGWLN
jgi:hypothetical protein